MKTEKEIRKRLNRLLVDYFNKKIQHSEKPKAEERIRELVWVLDEVILMENGKNELGVKDGRKTD